MNKHLHMAHAHASTSRTYLSAALLTDGRAEHEELRAQLTPRAGSLVRVVLNLKQAVGKRLAPHGVVCVIDRLLPVVALLLQLAAVRAQLVHVCTHVARV